jgi:hypothetical protein
VLVDCPSAKASSLMVGFIILFSSSLTGFGVDTVGVPALFGVLYINMSVLAMMNARLLLVYF